MAWTQADYDLLNAAIGSGAQQIEFKDKKITRYGMNDMLRLRDVMKAELESSSTGNAPCRVAVASYSKGL